MMENKLYDILAWVFMLSMVALMFIASSCTTPKSFVENTTIKKDSIVSVIDTISTSKTTTTLETIYKGIDEAFSVKADSTGFIPEYTRKFNTGAIQGEIGYSKEKGSYYNIKTKDLKERNHEVITDTTSKKKIIIINNTWIDTVSKTVLVTKKWGKFQWITFIISLLGIIYIAFRVYKLIINPASILKIFS